MSKKNEELSAFPVSPPPAPPKKPMNPPPNPSVEGTVCCGSPNIEKFMGEGADNPRGCDAIENGESGILQGSD